VKVTFVLKISFEATSQPGGVATAFFHPSVGLMVHTYNNSLAAQRNFMEIDR